MSQKSTTQESSTNTAIQESEDKRQLWQPGQSGNPNGRPKGSKNKLTLLKEAIVTQTETQLLQEFPKVVDAVIKQAKKGNLQAAKLLFDRVLPPKKAVEISGKDSGAIEVVIRRAGDTYENTPEIEIVDAEFEEQS